MIAQGPTTQKWQQQILNSKFDWPVCTPRHKKSIREPDVNGVKGEDVCHQAGRWRLGWGGRPGLCLAVGRGACASELLLIV